MEELGLDIMNGNIQGDETGELTFIGKKLCSVIYYAICNAEAWDKIHKLKIRNKTESDHRPIEITLERIKKRKKEEKERREIEDWTEEGCKNYKQIERKKRISKRRKRRMRETSGKNKKNERN